MFLSTRCGHITRKSWDSSLSPTKGGGLLCLFCIESFENNHPEVIVILQIESMKKSVNRRELRPKPKEEWIMKSTIITNHWSESWISIDIHHLWRFHHAPCRCQTQRRTGFSDPELFLATEEVGKPSALGQVPGPAEMVVRWHQTWLGLARL